jgi:glutamate formiminotransferase
MSLIECVPNVSEGRQPAVVSAITDAVRATIGVKLLDTSSDASHNRSVLTIAGEGAALQEAVCALVEAALPVIDLRNHEGLHPRMGAVDVVPFVPLTGASMNDCIVLARDTARVLSARYNLPTYLYAAAGTQREQLEHIRMVEFEHLATRMTQPNSAPDFGPPAPHPTAGATAVGARPPLIAYNVELATNRLDIGRDIAATIRERDGGLPAVKALAFPLLERGLVQISMNLVDHRRTSLRDAFDAVAREAGRHHVQVIDSEIIGLAPRDAIHPGDEKAVLLRQGAQSQIIEDRLQEAGLTSG